MDPSKEVDEKIGEKSWDLGRAVAAAFVGGLFGYALARGFRKTHEDRWEEAQDKARRFYLRMAWGRIDAAQRQRVAMDRSPRF